MGILRRQERVDRERRLLLLPLLLVAMLMLLPLSARPRAKVNDLLIGKRPMMPRREMFHPRASREEEDKEGSGAVMTAPSLIGRGTGVVWRVEERRGTVCNEW
jgi:hypothetical protein